MDSLTWILIVVGGVLAAIFGLKCRNSGESPDIDQMKDEKEDLLGDMQEADDDLEQDFEQNRQEAEEGAGDAPSDGDVESLIDDLRSRYGQSGGDSGSK